MFEPENSLEALSLAALGFLALLLGMPKGLKGTPVIFATWRAVGRSRALMLLLLITTLLGTGQYVVIAFAAPLLIRLRTQRLRKLQPYSRFSE